MALADLIAPEHVIVGLRPGNKTQLLVELANRAAAALSRDGDEIMRVLSAREQLGSTGLGKGFALPHAQLAGLAKPFGLFARLARPVDFESVDGQPVDIVVLLLTPAGAPAQHLSTLAALSRPLRDAGFVQQMRKAADAEAVRKLMAQH